MTNTVIEEEAMSDNTSPKKIDHIGIAVKSIDTVLPFYTDQLQLPCVAIEKVESEGVKIAFLSIGESLIELLEPLNEESPIAKFLEKYGEGIHHIALGVNDIYEHIEELKKKKIRMIHEQPKNGAGGSSIAFIHPKPANGVLYELCQPNQK
jgi:methylmalonyl-CoA/ethylmalonyl-CoA epimerase